MLNLKLFRNIGFPLYLFIYLILPYSAITQTLKVDFIRNLENSLNKRELDFIKNSHINRNYEILLVSGSNKKKNFDSVEVLSYLKKEKNLKVKLGIAYNPYLKKYYNVSSERERFERKISTGLINSIWFQYGTDIKVLQNEVTYLKNVTKEE